MAEIPAQFLLSASAPAARTLWDILTATMAQFPDAPAVDDGGAQLTYSELVEAAQEGAAQLAALGVGRGGRVGVRLPSGGCELYIAILSVIAAGCAYVPVDADDPQERADLVFAQAAVDATITAEGWLRAREERDDAAGPRPAQAPTPEDDAWIIFTSGSTGTPKGVAVTHRNAAAFVDAEARMFLQDEPIGPDDRVLAGLSVAFDASCEEMWLAWRHGACLVPAPRAIVRSGMDLGPWLVARDISVVSTVPTLASLWPPEALEAVRLLIFGGEACPPDLAARLVADGREVWNTYGPTEATVVACAAQLTGDGVVRIGLPLPGWDLAVVDPSGAPVEHGQSGELVIGGVGLARYLDPAKDAEKYAPAPALGWERAYRSGDLVRLESEGLVFLGRADDQVKIGGRRIELGEVDAALAALPGVTAAATAVQQTSSGAALLVGYLTSGDPDYDVRAARTELAKHLPAALVPRLVLLPELPVRTSGKVDRAALPWPVAGEAGGHGLDGTAGWLADLWAEVLGAEIDGEDADFFSLGGGSLAAAQLVSALRARYPTATVAELYDRPRLGSLADFLDEQKPAQAAEPRDVRPTPRRTQAAQALILLVVATLGGLQWVAWLLLANNLLACSHTAAWARHTSWWLVLGGVLLFATPLGRAVVAACAARVLTFRLAPGAYPRGGSVHLRVWAAEHLAAALGAENLSGAPWMAHYARMLGAKIGDGVDLHAIPPVTGMLAIGQRSCVEPEVDLRGHWLDGDVFHLGEIVIGQDAAIGARTTLLPGAQVGKDADVAPASCVVGKAKGGRYWKGSPAVKAGKAHHPWPQRRPEQSRRWGAVYAVSAAVIGGLPLCSWAVGLAVIGAAVRHAATLREAVAPALAATPLAALAATAAYALATLVGVRLGSLGVRAGYHPVHSRAGWQTWAVERLMDAARQHLFPLYASLATPVWMRLLGAKIGKNTEISTAVLAPKFTTVGEGAFLADDTMVGSYELGGGWIHIAETKVGERAFLGNSGITQPGRKIPNGALVAVLSATPHKAKSGSSWLGSPPIRLRRKADEVDASRTFAPPLRLKIIRAAVECCRITALIVSFWLGALVLIALQALLVRFGPHAAWLGAGVVLLAAGVLAAAVSVIVKWAVVGRFRPGEHPLWSSFVWRAEVADCFVESVAAPWFANLASGTGALNLWLRAMGAKIGRGVWCESYWLPEADLVSLGDGASVGRGCVVQTHLFHDRIMRLDSVTLQPGASLGPHCVALPGSVVGAGATVGPASLVLRGDMVPGSTRWLGNPISPWRSEPDKKGKGKK
ncbi:non-ribosomal peptide synthetase [Segniliparus rotundus DSM 44985]|uniref:Non-ribosomal peptide synthetase n=1 Tax=Segniliparus rotundus (strain ATCC BAA-972 / CDC 1076 / CIP 108378 / DSM 44985 / JCM 13578) TaxID=640132 RepID=D6ZE18_SEGRD|nr:Pls/PosA family non-ribosomal peptide synthetase [Segniliparus rotundus]ADG97298.1 non-ribosomal peptide synthetase [Segniliparus rotundus DSM 44985]